MFPATPETTSLIGLGTVINVNHSSAHGSRRSRFDKSRSACSGNAQTNGFRCTLRQTLLQIFTGNPSRSNDVQLTYRLFKAREPRHLSKPDTPHSGGLAWKLHP